MNKTCSVFRKYFAALSEIDGFINWVIAKVRVEKKDSTHGAENFKDSSKVSAGIKKQKKNYAVIIVQDDKVSFEVHLIRIVSKNEDGFNSLAVHDNGKGKVEFGEYLYDKSMNFYEAMVFEADEIMNFVDDVGDQNPIHRTKNSVVPGFLILENLLDDESITVSCDIKYILPVFEGEKIEIYKNDRKFEAWVWRGDGENCMKAVKIFELCYA